MTTSQPTQIERPWRATLRTVFQALIAFAGLAPFIAAAIEEATGYDLERVPFVITALLVCAAIARVMALPAVETFLSDYFPWLAADPDASVSRDERGSFQILRSMRPVSTETVRGASRDRALPGKARVHARRRRG